MATEVTKKSLLLKPKEAYELKWFSKNGKPYSVEVKVCRYTQRKSVQVPPVEKNRLNDDFIAIVHPTGYVLFESMKDHLKCCTPKGYRTLWN